MRGNFHTGRDAMKLRTLAGIILIYVLGVLPLQAWGPIGHMAVAYLAYEQLAPATKTRTNALLRLNPAYGDWEKQVPAGASAEDHDRLIFMMAANWADDIKSDPKYSDDGTDPNIPSAPTATQNIGYADLLRHRYWHFIDVPFSNDHTALSPVPTPNAKTQIEAFRAVLRGDQPDALKSYDMVWLLHLVGDIHQPLHAVARITQGDTTGDAGGNKVKLRGDADTNLHAYWDNLPGADCSFCKDKARCAERATVYAQHAAEPAAKRTLSPETDKWVEESVAAAKRDVYRDPIEGQEGPYTILPMSSYDAAAYRLAQERVSEAGARLAELLNRELK
jgi:hypothetical protein